MATQTVLEAKNISKRFGRVQALNKVNFSLHKGEIHGLLGENGAGKSTLMNIFYGLYRADEGEIYINGEKVEINSPLDSINLGIGMIHQSSTLVPEFTALENIILGIKDRRFSLGLKEEEDKVKKLSQEFGLDFPLHVKVRDLSAGIKQKVEIIRALYRGAHILILDEPTTSLVENEFAQLLESLKKLVKEGVTVVFITHKIREVLQACNRASVLKGGVMQGTVSTEDSSKEELVSLMFQDKDIEVNDSALPVIDIPEVKLSAEPVISVKNLYVTANNKDGVDLKDISFEVYGGEILGIAGISGNGQKELAEAIIHPARIDSGEIRLKGELINNYSTTQVFSKGVFYTPEDRKKEAILPLGSIKENVLLGHQREPRFQSKGVLKWNEVRQVSKDIIKKFQVKTPDEETPIGNLSGGNIQRVVIGRALINDIDLLITHNPTSGLDMASVEFVFKQMAELKARNSAILYINEDLDELMVVSDRIAVIHKGELVGIFEKGQFNKYDIGSLMIGG